MGNRPSEPKTQRLVVQRNPSDPPRGAEGVRLGSTETRCRDEKVVRGGGKSIERDPSQAKNGQGGRPKGRNDESGGEDRLIGIENIQKKTRGPTKRGKKWPSPRPSEEGQQRSQRA